MEKTLRTRTSIFGCFILFNFAFINSLSVQPLGLSGVSSNARNEFAKSVKYGGIINEVPEDQVSWSKNLDEELEMRRRLCSGIPERWLYQYRYHNETQSCYKIGTRGPCGDNMAFYAWPTNALYGQCDCNYNDFGRLLIYHEESNSCHFVFTKGFCNPGKWLILDKKWKPTCERNPCLSAYEEFTQSGPDLRSTFIEFVLFNKTCTLLGSSCADPATNIIQELEQTGSSWNAFAHLPHKVQFVKGKVYPRCAPSKFVQWRYPTPKIQCVPGGFLAHEQAMKTSNSTPPCNYESVYEP